MAKEMAARLPCRICYTCQVCISCEKYGEGAVVEGQPPMPVQQPQLQPPMPMPMPIQPPMPMPVQPLTEERVREIILEMLIQFGLVKPQQQRRMQL